MLSQIEIFSIPSPCIRVCQTDKLGFCVGCFRSRQERFDWLKYDDDQKRDVLRLCKQRALRKRYQQYHAKLTQAKEQIDLFETEEQLDLF